MMNCKIWKFLKEKNKNNRETFGLTDLLTKLCFTMFVY